MRKKTEKYRSEAPADGVIEGVFCLVGKCDKNGNFRLTKSIPCKLQASVKDDIFLIDVPDRNTVVALKFSEMFTVFAKAIDKSHDISEKEEDEEKCTKPEEETSN